MAVACTACGACREACPERIIAVDDSGRPAIDFTAGECSFCQSCANVCPEPVFFENDNTPWQMSLMIADACLATSGVYCRSCGDACAEGAIAFKPAIGGRAEIWFAQSDCSGCGACVSACPIGATALVPAAEETDG